MASANKLTLFIVIFMLLGILSGAVIHAYASPGTITSWAENITLFTDMFLRLIKMVIAPLVFSTLTVGIMRLGETATIGRVGGKAMVWFITSSILSILVGLVIVTLEHPGAGLNLAIPKESVDTGLAVSGMSLKGFLSHTIPTSITEAMANNEILQIVVFSMFFGIAGASLGEKFNAPLVAALNVVSHIMLKVTGYVMYVAPLAIFAAISSVIASQGMGILLNYASFIGGYYIAVLLTSAVLLAVGYMVLKKRSSACSTCSKIRCWWRLPPAALRRRIRRPWSGWSVLAARATSSPSCCRLATPLTWWGRWSTARLPRCLLPRLITSS